MGVNGWRNFVRQLEGNISLGRHWLDGGIILNG
jgi:hypothetical protein